MEKKARKPRKTKRLSYSAHVTKAKDLWRQAVVHSHQDDYGFCRCVTCGVRRQPTDPMMHCGHFIHRRNNTYFCLTNAHPQCATCNGYKLGQPRQYASWIATHYGAETLAWLIDQSNVRRDFTRPFLDRIIDESRIIVRLHGGKPCR